MSTPRHTDAGRQAISRRHLLTGGAAAAIVGAVAGASATLGVTALTTATPQPAAEPLFGGDRVPFFGAHQAGVATAPQAAAAFLAFDLAPGISRDALRRALMLLTDDAARLTQGVAPLADTEAELARVPARLTVTFGFGPRLVTLVTPGAAPPWLGPLPAFTIDRLESRWSDGDLLLQVCADDPVTVAHASRMLIKDMRAFGSLRWSQGGFRRAAGAEASGTTMRNLFGQVDGTSNPRPGTADFSGVVWATDGPAWLSGGTSLVLRRIAMNLDTWDEVDRPGRERAVGRTLTTGAPLTGTAEADRPDLDAVDGLGLPVIPAHAHLRRARTENPRERIFRRGYNYEHAEPGTEGSAGLLFASYQADVTAQFVPIQRRLDTLDLLNVWTTPVGSAVFAIPPGCAEGGFIGETLFSA